MSVIAANGEELIARRGTEEAARGSEGSSKLR